MNLIVNDRRYRHSLSWICAAKKISVLALLLIFAIVGCRDKSTNPGTSLPPSFTSQVSRCLAIGLPRHNDLDSVFTYSFDQNLVMDFSVIADCCSDSSQFIISDTLSADTIIVSIANTAIGVCDCLCPRIVHAELTNLPEDHYVVLCRMGQGFGTVYPIHCVTVHRNPHIIEPAGQVPAGREPFYEVEYVNFAWGYQHFGYSIQKDGYLYSYDFAGTGDVWRDTSNGYYSEQELIAKFSHNDTLRKAIQQDTLAWAYALAQSAQSGFNSDTVSAARDMGAFLYIVYLYEPELGKYKQLLLRQDGDWTFYNTSTSAGELVDWLRRTVNPGGRFVR